jgi:hypothetical protein
MMESPTQPEDGHAAPPMKGTTECAFNMFQQPWWLDIVAPGSWGDVTVERGGATVARMPYVLKKRLGIRVITMPILTPTLGPWILQSEGKKVTQASDEKELMQDLIAKLPRFDAFRQRFAPEITNWLPFYWAGYGSDLHYTYRIDTHQTREEIWQNFRHSLRTRIRRAQKLYTIRDDIGVEDFIRLNQMTFDRKQIETRVTPALIHRLEEACSKRKCRSIVSAVDASGTVQGMIYLIWDHEVVYYIMAGSTLQGKQDSVHALLLWEGIQWSMETRRLFDFEGSMIEPVERFFRTFGARQVPILNIHKERPLMGGLLKISQELVRFSGRFR